MADDTKKPSPFVQGFWLAFGTFALFFVWAIVAGVCLALLLGSIAAGFYVKQEAMRFLPDDQANVVAGAGVLICILCSIAYIRQAAIWLSGGPSAASPGDRPKPLYTGGHRPSDLPTNNKRGSDGRPVPPGPPPSGGSSGETRVVR